MIKDRVLADSSTEKSKILLRRRFKMTFAKLITEIYWWHVIHNDSCDLYIQDTWQLKSCFSWSCAVRHLHFQPPPETRWPTDFPAAAVVSVSRRAPSRRCRSHIWCYNCCVPHRTAKSSKFQWLLAPRWWDKNPRSCRWCRLDADFDDWPRAVSCWKPHQWSHMEANPPNFVPPKAAIWVQLAKTCREGDGAHPKYTNYLTPSHWHTNHALVLLHSITLGWSMTIDKPFFWSSKIIQWTIKKRFHTQEAQIFPTKNIKPGHPTTIFFEAAVTAVTIPWPSHRNLAVCQNHW